MKRTITFVFAGNTHCIHSQQYYQQFLQHLKSPLIPVLYTPSTHLENLAAGGFVAVVAHVIAIVGWWGPQTEHVAENTNDSQEALHLSFITAWQAEEKNKYHVSSEITPRMPLLSQSALPTMTLLVLLCSANKAKWQVILNQSLCCWDSWDDCSVE